MVPALWTRESDADLVRRVLRNQPDAFEALILRYQEKACAIALGIGVRPDALRDVLQEAFLRSFQDLPALRKREVFGPWFLTIVRNAARRKLRDERPVASLPPGGVAGRSYPEGPEKSDFNEYLWGQVDRLPEGVREPIFLYYYQGESVKEVARTLDITRSAVKKRLQRGRELLRERLWSKLEDCLRDMLPSTREWSRGARRMTLLVMAALPASWAAEAKAASAAAVPAGVPLAASVTGGLLVMGGKKIVGAAVIAALLLLGGFIVLRETGPETERETAGTRGRATSSGLNRGLATEAGNEDDTARARSVQVLEREIPPPVDLSRVDRDLDLFGVVVDEAGAPVPGARVQTVYFPWTRVVVPSSRSRETRVGPGTVTATDGTFAVRLVRGQVVNLKVSAPGLATTWLAGLLAGEKVRVVLQDPAELEVLVKDEDGKPVPDAEVTLGRIEEWVSVWTVAQGRTDTRGRHTFRDLEPGEVSLGARHETFRDSMGHNVVLHPATRSSLEVVLPTAGRVIRGRVTDALTGEPVPGAHVCEIYWGERKTVIADAGGVYEFPGWIRRGDPALVARAEGYGCESRFVPEVGDVDFELKPGRDLMGRVVDGAGDPIEGALAAVFDMGGKGRFESPVYDKHTVLTDGEGAFSFPDLRPDLLYTGVIHSPRHGSRRIRVELGPG